MRERSRPAAVACGVVALAALTGCSATGDLWVGEDDVRVDIVVHREPTDEAFACSQDNLPPGFVVEPLEASADEVACRVTGTVALRDTTGEDSWPRFIMGESDGFVTMLLPAFGIGLETGGGIDLTAHLPGEVLAVSAGAVVEGTTVRWTDIEAVRTQGLAFTARTRPALPAWLLPAAAGLLAGGLVVPAFAWLPRRAVARPSRAEPDDNHEDDPTPVAAEPGAGRPALDPPPAAPRRPDPEDPEVWSRP